MAPYPPRGGGALRTVARALNGMILTILLFVLIMASPSLVSAMGIPPSTCQAPPSYLLKTRLVGVVSPSGANTTFALTPLVPQPIPILVYSTWTTEFTVKSTLGTTQFWTNDDAYGYVHASTRRPEFVLALGCLSSSRFLRFLDCVHPLSPASMSLS